MENFKINGRKFETNESKITGREILTLANFTPVGDYELLYKVNEKGFTPIQLEEVVDLSVVGIEGFKAKLYQAIDITIDEESYKVEEYYMTPIEIMRTAGLDPDDYSITELRTGLGEISYEDDVNHKVRLTNKSQFLSRKIEREINCVIVSGKPHPWKKDKISFEEVVILRYGTFSNNPRVIYTVEYVKGVPNKPCGDMVRGQVISVNNKMVFNVGQANQS